MHGFKSQYIDLLESTDLRQLDKDIIKRRYVALVTSTESEYLKIKWFYFILMNIITVSGILITAFVSFNKLSLVNDTTTNAFLWVVWALGILLTLSNKWLYVFSIPKKYVLNNVTLEKLYSEGWSFISVIGKYKNIPDATTRFKLFCTRIEKIRSKSIEVISGIDSTEAVMGILSTGSNTRPGQTSVHLSNVTTIPMENIDAVDITDLSNIADVVIGGGSEQDTELVNV